MNTPAVTPRITGATTYGDLALIRAKMGIVRIHMDVDWSMSKPILMTVSSLDFETYGWGDTEWEALDEAICRLWHRQGHQIRTGLRV